MMFNLPQSVPYSQSRFADWFSAERLGLFEAEVFGHVRKAHEPILGLKIVDRSHAVTMTAPPFRIPAL